VNVDHVDVGDARGRAGLGHELIAMFGVREGLAIHHFDGDEFADHQVLGFVHFAARARADFTEQRVLAVQDWAGFESLSDGHLPQPKTASSLRT